MISETREAFNLSGRGYGRLFYPSEPVAHPLVAAHHCYHHALVSLLHMVDLLSYISSAGYYFVLFWATLP
jgi:hypothetical protein